MGIQPREPPSTASHGAHSRKLDQSLDWRPAGVVRAQAHIWTLPHGTQAWLLDKHPLQTSGFQYKCKTLPRFVQALILPTVFKYMYLEGKVAKKRGDSEIFHSLVQSPNATAGTLGLARGCRGPSAWVMLRCFSRCTSKKLGSQPGARVRCGVPGRRPTTPSHQLSPGDFL